MQRVLPSLVGMYLCVFLGPGCSGVTSQRITPSPTQNRFALSSTSPLSLSILPPSETGTNNFPPTDNPTPAYPATPSPETMYTLTLDPMACIPMEAEVEYGLVKWVPDGDTIVVDILGRLHSVHYLGIRTPSFVGFTEYRGPNAARFNETLVRNQLVRLVKDGPDKDSFDELLRYVLVGNVFLNYEMVRNGLAYAVVENPDIACEDTFVQAEESAKQEVLGLWEPTRTPHHTSIPTLMTIEALPPGSPITPTPTIQVTGTSTSTPVYTSTFTITPTSTLTPTATDILSPTPEITGTSTLTTTGYSNLMGIYYGNK
jgi:endonuclease YncB( thermonuclease family)